MKIEKITPQIAALYLGQKCDIDSHNNQGFFRGNIYPMDIAMLASGNATIVPHLRRLESLTEEEALELFDVYFGRKFNAGTSPNNSALDWFHVSFRRFEDKYPPAVWLKLLEWGIDLFGLIDAGLAKEVEPKNT